MLKLLEIENYQSLRKLRLPLGRLTVITGRTGSGKTAVLRAARLLAFNARGTDYITRGQKSCSVRLEDDEFPQPHIAIARGGRGGDSYTVERAVPVPAGGYGRSGGKFTKLNGQVPPQVAELLRLSPLNFASQFDQPYLLGSSAGEVARTLGELTNVTTIFKAAGEANRRKQRLAGQLKDQEAELERLREQARGFAGLRQRREAAQQAQAALAAAQGLQARADRLRLLLGQQALAQEALAAAGAAVREVPSLEAAEAACGWHARLQSLMLQAESLQAECLAASSAVDTDRLGVQNLEREHRRLLEEAGVCPVCGQAVH